MQEMLREQKTRSGARYRGGFRIGEMGCDLISHSNIANLLPERGCGSTSRVEMDIDAIDEMIPQKQPDGTWTRTLDGVAYTVVRAFDDFHEFIGFVSTGELYRES